jgi:putative Mg2+ transporter-C (MgtC) family protein
MPVEYNIIIPLVMSVLLGGLIGIEREKNHKPAGMRTHMLVCMGACLFTMASISFTGDPARVAANIVTGIGFIGAGTIIASKEKIVGVTTAASLWATSAIGLFIGISDYAIGIVATFLVLFILLADHIVKKCIP